MSTCPDSAETSSFVEKETNLMKKKNEKMSC